MDPEKLNSVQLSLLLKKSEIGPDGRAAYAKKVTSKFTFPPEFSKTEDSLRLLLREMFRDMHGKLEGDADSLGMWIEYGSETLENAVSLGTLESIQEYSREDVDCIFEFFKMTVQE